MKKLTLLTLSALTAHAALQADVELHGEWDNTCGAAVISPKQPMVFGSAKNPDGRLIVLGVELIQENAEDAVINCSIAVVQPNGKRFITPSYSVALKWNIPTDCSFQTNEGMIPMKLMARRSFLADLLNQPAQGK